MIWKFFSFVVSGFVTSYFMYDKTHSGDVPELTGIVAGCLLVIVAFDAMWNGRNDDAVQCLVAAFSAVGTGVAINRLRMSINNDGVQ